MMLPALLLSGSCTFAFALAFFSRWLFRDIEVKWGLGFTSQLVFALTLTDTFHVMLAATGVLEELLRNEAGSNHDVQRWGLRTWWEGVLGLCVLLLRVVVPLLTLWAAAAAAASAGPASFRSTSTLGRAFRAGKVMTSGLVVVGLSVAWLMPLVLKWNWTRPVFDNVARELAGLSMAGLTTVAVMAGWGSVHGPYVHGPWFQKQYDDAQILTAEGRLLSVLDAIGQTKRDRALAGARNRKAKASDTSGWWGWSNPAGDQDARLESLHMLSREVFLELVEMRRARAWGRFRLTWRGKFFTLLGYVFAVFCVVRIAVAVYALVGHHPTNITNNNEEEEEEEAVDLITKLIRLGVGRITTSPESATYWAHTISTVLVGVLVFNSFRGLLLTVGNLFLQIADGDARFGVVVSLVLTELMGLYMLSSAQLLSLSLPSEFTQGRSLTLSSSFRGVTMPDVDAFRAWGDAVFVVSSCCSVVLLWVADRAKQSRTEFYGDAGGGGVHKQDKLV